jgi:hypothetical protein
MMPEFLLAKCGELLGSPLRETGTRYPVCPPFKKRVKIFLEALELLRERCWNENVHTFRFYVIYVLSRRRLVTPNPCRVVDKAICKLLSEKPLCIPPDCFIGLLPWNPSMFLHIADIRGGFEIIEPPEELRMAAD